MAGISKAERERRAAEAEASGGSAEEGTSEASQDEAAAEAEAVATVAMVRDPEQYPPPHAADVHPDEVANFAAAGWLVGGKD